MKSTDVVNNIIKLFHEQKLAHAYLCETNDIDKCKMDIVKIVKELLCNSVEKECNICNTCHLIDSLSHPSFILIEPDGKNIKKESIEMLKNAFSKMPIYSSCNVYLIIEPEKMNSTAYNKMLKFLEEPEQNIYGFFITLNKDYVPPTIVSRCEVIKFYYDVEKMLASSKYEDIVKEYTNMINLKSKNILWYNVNVVQKVCSERQDVVLFLNLLLHDYMKSISEKEYTLDIKKKINIINKYLNELNYNVNIALLLDSLALEMVE